jgi:hypothetical protein
MLAIAGGDDEGALRDALLDYVRDVDEVEPAGEQTASQPAATRVAIDIVRRSRVGTAGSAAR